MSYDNANRGAIWPNEGRVKETHPHFKGNLTVKIEPEEGESQEEFIKRLADGLDFWVVAWKKKPTAAPKAPSLSFSIERKEEKYQTDKAPADDIDFDDDIPF